MSNENSEIIVTCCCCGTTKTLVEAASGDELSWFPDCYYDDKYLGHLCDECVSRIDVREPEGDEQPSHWRIVNHFMFEVIRSENYTNW